MKKKRSIYYLMLLGETLSLIFGGLNLVIWFGILVPQIYKNYQNSCSKGLSYLLFYKLLIGGMISLTIALIKRTSLTIVYIGIHHLIITTILMSQLLYYRFKKDYIRLPSEDISTLESKVGLTKTEKLITIIVSPIVFTLLGIVILTKNVILIDILAWLSNILFTTSKFTQIYINYKKKSTNGLSKISFICMIFTDLCFMASVLVNIIDKPISEVILKNIPWLSSCSISLISGTIILIQFKLYNMS